MENGERNSMGRKSILTDGGHDFFEVASLLQKSLRRGDITMCARAANELFPRYVNYTWNRLMTVSAEDCGEMVTSEIVALFDAWSKVNEGKSPKNKGRIFFAKAIILLAKSKHDRSADELNILVSDRLPEKEFIKALNQVEEVWQDAHTAIMIPNYVYDVHTYRGKRMGKTKRQFLVEESEALTDKETIFENLDEMIESNRYKDPQGRLF